MIRMDNRNVGMIRLSLPPATILKGEKDTYVTQQLLSTSERSVTVKCYGSDKRSWRLKLYNGVASITEEIQKKIMNIDVQGVVRPVDIGEYGSRRFWVFEHVNMKKASEYPIDIQVLKDRIIPQLVYIMNQYHKNRILLRDICPSHVLYEPQSKQIRYTGLSNAALLLPGATVTKAKGMGQEICFLAPEIKEYGYSIYSDYYALGMTILTLVKGYNPFEKSKPKEIMTCYAQGNICGIDLEHLKRTPYELYSEEDKVLYLVLGLLFPNPKDRWGFSELRCWCNDQHIPLTRKEGKIVYQYNEPFLVGTVKCWNYRQITEQLAANADFWKEQTVSELLSFMKRQKVGQVGELQSIAENTDLSNAGKVFWSLYLLNPGLEGLWWKGQKFANTEELSRAAARDQHINVFLAELLRDRCISYFLKARRKVTDVAEKDILEFAQMENWERNTPGKGVSRCRMRFAQSEEKRTFTINGCIYSGVEDLIDHYKDKGLKLRRNSKSILENASFQAWLWANGMDAAAECALRSVKKDQNQSFYLLLKLCEMHSKDPVTLKTLRRLYLQYGEFAPVYWLTNHTNYYKTLSVGYQPLLDAFRGNPFDLNQPLERLSEKAGQLVFEYQSFVEHTCNDKQQSSNIRIESVADAYYPLKPEYFFDMVWEDRLEVCRSFLAQMADGL